MARVEPGSTTHSSVSPASTPSTAAMASGTDVRTAGESDRTGVTLEVNARGKEPSPEDNAARPHKRRQQVGQSLISVPAHYRQRVRQRSESEQPEGEIKLGIIDRTKNKHDLREKARTLIAQGRVHRITRAEYLVDDGEGQTRVYKAYKTWRCASCQGGHTQDNPCLHIFAVIGAANDVDLNPPGPPDYKTQTDRNWPALRQANEAWSSFFQWTVGQIADTFEEDEGAPRRGRRPHSIRDQFIQTITWKEGNTSMDQANGALGTHGFHDLMDRKPSYVYASKFLGLEKTRTLLEKWLLATTLLAEPYEAPEVAIDGTYFTNLHRTNPPRYRQGLPIRTAPRRLAVPITTYRWNLVPAVAVPDNYDESSRTLPLLHRSMSILDIKRVAADRGYPSKQFTWHAEHHGYEIVMPFKRGTTITEDDSPEGVAFNKAVAQRALAPAKYWQQNQKRKNAEAQNSSTKTRFGQILRCRNPVKQANEIRLQYVILNLRRLCLLSVECAATFDFRLAWRHVNQLPWLTLDSLHEMLNGPARLQYLQNLDPRARPYDTPGTGQMVPSRRPTEEVPA